MKKIYSTHGAHLFYRLLLPRLTSRDEIMVRTAPSRFSLISNNAFSLLNFRGPLLTEIVGRGHTVFALAPDFNEETRSAARTLGVEPVDFSLSRTGINPLRDAVDTMRLVRILRTLQLDYVLSFAIKPVIYGTIAARIADVPRRHALIAGLGYAFSEDKQSAKQRIVNFAARTLYQLALSGADRVFMQNPDDVEDFVRLGLARREQVVRVNGTGVDLDSWTFAPPAFEPISFVLAARLLAEKGIFEFVAAARRIKRDAPNVRFILLGGLDTNPNGISRGDVEAWVKEGVLEWPGHVPVRPWLLQTSVFVLPSYYREGVPRSTQEAMAMGRPVITTNAPGCRETVIDGDNGFLVPPRDPDMLAAAMWRFIDNPGLVASMGQRSRQLAEERFDVRKVNKVMIEAMGL